MTIHINTAHAGKGPDDTTDEALACAQICFCDACGEAVSNSNAGRNAHARKGCGTFISKNTRIRNAKADFTGRINPEQPPDAAARQAARTAARSAEIGTAEIDDEEFFSSRPPSVRYLKRWNWNQWTQTVLISALRGYSGAPVEQRLRRQFTFVQLVRQRLKKSKSDPTLAHADSSFSTERVEALTEIGAFSKATTYLCSTTGVAAMNDTTMEKLHQLHPNAEPLDVQQLQASLERHSLPGISEDEVLKAVRSRLSCGAAPGMDGWTRELLLPLVQDSECLAELTVMLADLSNGITSAPVLQRLLASPLIALQKEDGGVRPIAIESTLIKLLATIALGRVSDGAWKKAFPHIQFGVGPSANLEHAVHTLRDQVKAANYAILVDCTNAFNTVSREAIFEQLKKNDGLWPLYRLASWSLRPSPLIVLNQGKQEERCKPFSQTGVRQGSVLGPLLFCLALQPVLTRLNSTCEVTIGAYLDDITIAGKDAGAVSLAFAALEKELKKIGLCINMNKTIAMSRSHEIAPLHGLAGEIKCQYAGVTKLLGAAVWMNSSNQERSAFVLARMKRHELFFTRVSTSGISLATQLALLQQCGTGRPTFLLRTHDWEDTVEAAAWFDKSLEGSLQAIAGLDAQLTDVASLPVRNGGLGLRSAAELAEIANSSRDKGEQKTLTEELDQTKLASIRATMADRDRQILSSFAQANVRGVHVPDDALRQYARERLFLPIVPEGTSCTCGQLLDAAHVHSCPSLGAARIRRHDNIKLLVAKLAARTYTVRVEPSRLLSASRSRPDLQICTPEGLVHVDVSCTYMGLMRTDPLAARAAEKTAKYAAHVEGFVPFVVASTGQLHIDAVSLLARLVPRAWERETARLELLGALILGNHGLLRDALA